MKRRTLNFSDSSVCTAIIMHIYFSVQARSVWLSSTCIYRLSNIMQRYRHIVFEYTLRLTWSKTWWYLAFFFFLIETLQCPFISINFDFISDFINYPSPVLRIRNRHKSYNFRWIYGSFLWIICTNRMNYLRETWNRNYCKYFDKIETQTSANIFIISYRIDRS